MAWNPKADPIVGGRDPVMGGYVTRSGKVVTDAEYNRVKGTKAKPPAVSAAPANRVDNQAVTQKNRAGIRLPGVPHTFTNRAALLKFLKSSPGYVKKQRGWLNAHHQDALHDAGWAVGKNAKLVKYVAPKKRPIFKPTPQGQAAPAAAAPAPQEQAVDPLSGLTIPTVDFSTIDKLNPATGVMINPKAAQGGARLFGGGAAEAQAGLQFDDQILKLRNDALKAPLDTQQHVKDIGSWYGQVLSSLKTAGERDAAIGKAAVQETVDNTAAISSAIGGSANAGSGLVGAAGAEAAGTLSALGMAQDQYNTDLAPILQAEAAAQKTRESAAGTGRLADLNLQIASALGQRGQAKAVNQFQIDQANNGILDNRADRTMQIIQANNQSRQQNFSNRYGIETTKLGAQVSGAQVAGDLAQTVIQETADAAAATQKKGPKSWSETAASQKKYAYENFVGDLTGRAKQLQANPKQLMNFTRNYVNRMGWSVQNPAVQAWIRNAYAQAGIKV